MLEEIEKKIDSLVDEYRLLKPIIEYCKKNPESDLKHEVKAHNIGVNFKGELYSNYALDDTLNSFGENGIKYLKRRLKETSNPYLKTKYSLILFEVDKNNKFLNEAINALHLCLEQIEKEGTLEWHYFNHVIVWISLSDKIKNINTNVYTKIFELLGKNNIEPKYKFHLIKYAVENKKVFKTEELQKIKGTFDELYVELEYSHNKIDISEIGIKLYQRLQLDYNFFYDEIGETYAKMAIENEDNEKDKTHMRAHEFINRALRNFKKSGNKEKSKKWGVDRQRIKKKVKLHEFQINFIPENEQKKLIEASIAFREDFLDRSPAELFSFLTHGFKLFPDKDFILNYTKNANVGFLNHCLTIHYDINDNTTKEPTSKEGKEILRFFKNYGLILNLYGFQVINDIFLHGLRRNQISFENTIDFFTKHSWFVQLTMHDKYAEKNYSWLELLKLPIEEYFNQVVNIFIGKSSNFQMCIDSLVTKFEGIFRQLAQFKGADTVSTKKDGERELFLHEMLRNKDIQCLFNEEDIILFRYLYLKEGLNIRNNVCHGFVQPTYYNFLTANLVLMSIFRLGKYKLELNS